MFSAVETVPLLPPLLEAPINFKGRPSPGRKQGRTDGRREGDHRPHASYPTRVTALNGSTDAQWAGDPRPDARPAGLSPFVSPSCRLTPPSRREMQFRFPPLFCPNAHLKDGCDQKLALMGTITWSRAPN